MYLHRLRPSRLRGVLAACILSAPMLVACGKSALPVSIYGVNYSVDPFSFELQDPSNPNNRGDGELVDSYAAGGTTCCYELPKKWRPGIKLSIQSKHWIGKLADDSLHDIASTHMVEVPQYADGKPGELWVLRAADGSMDIVSSDFQPDHPKWPGKVKGWPIPSLKYQRERWDLYINVEADYVKAFKSLIQKLDSSPDETAQDDWDTTFEYDPKGLAGFSGPRDVKFRERLKKEYAEGLEQSQTELDRLQKGRP